MRYFPIGYTDHYDLIEVILRLCSVSITCIFVHIFTSRMIVSQTLSGVFSSFQGFARMRPSYALFGKKGRNLKTRDAHNAQKTFSQKITKTGKSKKGVTLGQKGRVKGRMLRPRAYSAFLIRP
jgi:hypothetical protein